MRFGTNTKALYGWHPWFAWRPVEIEGTGILVWREWLERKAENGVMGTGLEYRYRFKDERDNG